MEVCCNLLLHPNHVLPTLQSPACPFCISNKQKACSKCSISSIASWCSLCCRQGDKARYQCRAEQPVLCKIGRDGAGDRKVKDTEQQPPASLAAEDAILLQHHLSVMYLLQENRGDSAGKTSSRACGGFPECLWACECLCLVQPVPSSFLNAFLDQ